MKSLLGVMYWSHWLPKKEIDKRLTKIAGKYTE